MWAQVAIAYVVDMAFGDPQKLPHPVVLIGRMISFLERILLRDRLSKVAKRSAGAVAVIIVVGISASITWAVIYLATLAHDRLGFIVSVVLISTTIAAKGLADHARDVVSALNANDLSLAREKVSRIVGRDTNNMEEKDIIRATIESVAENSVDGVIAPIIYALIGGAPLAMAYKAINTLDSMIGYKNERYEDFGWAAARMDDIVNYIPARISVLLIALAAFLCRHSAKNAVTVAMRDGRNHASPNSGFPEAAIAGAIGVTLGGTNYYGGIPRDAKTIGGGQEPLTIGNIDQTILIVFVASAITVLLARALIFAVDNINYVTRIGGL